MVGVGQAPGDVQAKPKPGRVLSLLLVEPRIPLEDPVAISRWDPRPLIPDGQHRVHAVPLADNQIPACCGE